MTFEYGQIVLVPVPDGRGHSEPHPAVILSPTDQIGPGVELRVVCVSTQVEDPCPPHHVPLPWQRPRHARTGLNKPNVAKCNWLARVDQSEVIKVLGFVPARELKRIEEALRTLQEEQRPGQGPA
jgi:mRNA-degrading endonuclease toxin of MazEF toxin-antitoxin module